MVFLLQLGVLALTVVLWWRVQQSLSGRASTPPLAEWKRLRATVEQLTADLERRAVVAEQRVAAAEASLAARIGATGDLAANDPSGDYPAANDLAEGLTGDILSGGQISAPPQSGSTVPHNAAFTHAENLIAAGEASALEIARQTGVSRGEAELLLSLRSRRV